MEKLAVENHHAVTAPGITTWCVGWAPGLRARWTEQLWQATLWVSYIYSNMRNGHVYFVFHFIYFINIYIYNMYVWYYHMHTILYQYIIPYNCNCNMYIYIYVYLSMKMFTIYNMGLSDNGLYLLNGHWMGKMLTMQWI